MAGTQRIDYEKAIAYTFAEAPGRARRPLKFGDYLFCTVRPNLQGFAKFEPPDADETWVGSTGLAVARAKPGVHGDFVFYQLLSEIGQRQFHALVTGSNYPAISESQFKKLELLSPGVEEQRRISTALSLVDTAIVLTQASIAGTQKLKNALMQNLLTGKLKPDGTWRREEEFYIDPKFGRVPTGWSWRQVRTFGEIITGRTPPPADESNYAEAGYPFMTPGDIGESRVVVQTERYVTELGLRFSNIIPAGAVCVVCIGSTIGKVGVAGTKCCSNQQINALIPDNGCDGNFLYFLLKSQQQQLHLWAGVNATPQLNKSEFGKFRVLAPTSEDEQKAIASPLLEIGNVIDHKTVKIERLWVLKKALMQNLLTGKIRIPAE